MVQLGTKWYNFYHFIVSGHVFSGNVFIIMIVISRNTSEVISYSNSNLKVLENGNGNQKRGLFFIIWLNQEMSASMHPASNYVYDYTVMQYWCRLSQIPCSITFSWGIISYTKIVVGSFLTNAKHFIIHALKTFLLSKALVFLFVHQKD